MTKIKEESLLDFIQRIQAERKKRSKIVWKTFLFSIISGCIIIGAVQLNTIQNVFNNVLLVSSFIFCLMFQAIIVRQMFKITDRKRIIAMKAEKNKLKEDLTNYRNMPNILDEHPELASAPFWAGLHRYAELALEKDTEISLTQQKINWLRNHPWQLISWGQKTTVIVILSNIILIGAIWIFIPFLWLCIVLSVIIVIIELIALVIGVIVQWGYFINSDNYI